MRRAGPDDSPDVCIVNTCTVTSVADRKSRQQAARMVREFPRAEVYATGCYATADPADLEAVEGLQGVFGRNEWTALLHAIAGRPAGALTADFGPGVYPGRARAYLKIQDGCDSFCSYCILPHVRGKPRSNPLPRIQEQATELAASGYREIVLTGIHLGLYGRDLSGGSTLADAVRAVADVDGVERLRLSSLRPNEVCPDLLDAMIHPVVCPHLHLPLQSGDDDVLRRMNRRYTAREFLNAVKTARERLDNPAITSDVIVGFPGESDAAFAATLRVCEEARFSRLHVFPFSPRAGTPAAGMPQDLGPDEIKARAAELRDLGDRMASEWARGFVAAEVRVLFEQSTRNGRLSGYSDRYVRTVARADPELLGRVVPVRCESHRGPVLVGSVPSDTSA